MAVIGIIVEIWRWFKKPSVIHCNHVDLTKFLLAPSIAAVV